MPIPTPEPGLVISYSYLWDREAQAGRDEGSKDRPCVIALAVESRRDGTTIVTILPITHRAPVDPKEAVEIPAAVKTHLGLDAEKSWIVISEGDQFLWPGHDLRRISGSERFDYGFLPPRFFASVLNAFRAWHRARKVRLTPRS